MPREVTQLVYKYDELSKNAQAKARDWWRESASCDDFWSEYVIDEAVQVGNAMGFTFADWSVPTHGGGVHIKPRIYWSGFYTQGSGACFEATWRASDVKPGGVKALGWGPCEDTTRIHDIAADFEALAAEHPTLVFKTKHRDRYYHSNSVDFEFWETRKSDSDTGEELDEYDWVEDDVESLCKGNARAFMDYIYDMLKKSYEDYVSDETVADTIIANEYEFDEDGCVM